MKIITHIILVLTLLAAINISKNRINKPVTLINKSQLSTNKIDERKIRELNIRYVNAWKKNDKSGVLSLFTIDATLAPSGLNPLNGINEIKAFWFPKDRSATTILAYTNEIFQVYIEGDIAQSSHRSYVKWAYKKGELNQKKEQWSIGTTVYKKKANGEWKIFHQMSKTYKKNDLPVADIKSDEEKIRAINKKYISEWLNNNETGVLSLFTDDATLAPSGVKPIKGMKEIRAFWFPHDSSVTTILKFTNDIQYIYVEEDIAETSQLDHLLWTYKKGNISMKREQWGFTQTIYKRQADGEWKIIHHMWKDYKIVDK